MCAFVPCLLPVPVQMFFSEGVFVFLYVQKWSGFRVPKWAVYPQVWAMSRLFVHICALRMCLIVTWWLIPLSKWVITPVISGLTLLIPFITGVITHLLSGMSHQVVPTLTANGSAMPWELWDSHGVRCTDRYTTEVTAAPWWICGAPSHKGSKFGNATWDDNENNIWIARVNDG